MKRDLPHPMRRDASLASCVALIDQRYLSWLLGQTPESEPINRFALHGVLSGLMEHAGVSAEVQRIYWYADVKDDALPNGLIHRQVSSRDADGGASIRTALAADLKVLAERKAFRHVVLATDDQSLVQAIDDAQLHGVSVLTVAMDNVNSGKNRGGAVAPVLTRR